MVNLLQKERVIDTDDMLLHIFWFFECTPNNQSIYQFIKTFILWAKHKFPPITE